MLKNFKTTIAGIVAGLPIAVHAIFQAITDGTLTGQSGSQLLMGLGIVLLGAYAKDHNVTGGTQPQTIEAENRLAVAKAAQPK